MYKVAVTSPQAGEFLLLALKFRLAAASCDVLTTSLCARGSLTEDVLHKAAQLTCATSSCHVERRRERGRADCSSTTARGITSRCVCISCCVEARSVFCPIVPRGSDRVSSRSSISSASAPAAGGTGARVAMNPLDNVEMLVKENSLDLPGVVRRCERCVSGDPCVLCATHTVWCRELHGCARCRGTGASLGEAAEAAHAEPWRCGFGACRGLLSTSS